MFGRVVFASSFAGYFTLLACLGIPLYGMREIAKVRNSKEMLRTVYSELLIINFCSTALSIVLYMITVLFVSRVKGDYLLYAVTGIMIVANFATIDWFFQGMENYRNITLRNIGVKAVALALLFVFVKNRSDYIVYATVNVSALVATNVLGLVRAMRQASFTIVGVNPFRHLRPILTLFSSTLAVSIFMYLDTVLLGFLSGDRYVGLYNAAVKIDRIAVTLITAMGMVLIPRISYYLTNNKIDEYRTVAEKSIHFIYFLGFPFMVGLVLLAPQIVTVLAGSAFSDAILTVRIAAPILLIIGISNFIGLQILFPQGGEKILFWATFLAACVDIGLNLLLIPVFKHNGAAMAMVCAECTALGFYIILSPKKTLAFTFFDKQSFMYFFASAVMGAVVWGILRIASNALAALVVSTVLGALVYCGVLMAFSDPLVREMHAFVRIKLPFRVKPLP
jgi:O-antigen/teichoic acid export membrane protein